MTRYQEADAIDFIFTKAKPAVNIVNLGYLARYIKTVHNPENTFYMNGSMGLCLAFSVGVASQSNNTVNCIVGDGAFLMNLQSLVMLRSFGEPLLNLRIIMVDNHCHNSTGAQPSYSEKIDFKALCQAFHLHFFTVASDKEFEAAYTALDTTASPALIHIAVERLTRAPARITDQPAQIMNRFLKNSKLWMK